jgi:hypothetical protein
MMIIGFNPNMQNIAYSYQFDAPGERKLVLECPPARFEICGVVVLAVVWGEDVVGEIVIQEFLPQKRLKDLEKKEGENDMHG